MAWPRGRLLGSHRFEFGDAFPADEKMARYVLRLSMALGDLRIVAEYATRGRQREYERLYFIRLFCLHMREIANLLDPPDQRIVPTMDEFVRSLPRGTKPSRAEVRGHHAQVMRRLKNPMKGRHEIEIKRRGKDSVRRVPTLRDELKRIRDDFAHYGHNAQGADNVVRAMRQGRELRTGYVIYERSLRAQYADEAANTLTHPFDFDNRAFALDMHGRIVDLVDPVSSYIHCVEAAWLSSRPPGIVTSKIY